MRIRGLTRRDAAALGILALAALLLHLPVLFGGRVYFTNDLTHISFPWRVLTAEQLASGQVPLWNPYAFFGMPLLGNMQTGVFHPPSLIGHIFPFRQALGWLILANQVLAALWTYLWLRRWGCARLSCLAGAAVYSLGGYMLGFLQFPNLQAAVATLPAFVLFFGSIELTALAGASAFLAGYPPGAVMAAAGAFVLSRLGPGGKGFGKAALRSIAGLALGCALAAAVILPGASLFGSSARAEGVPLEMRLNNALRPLQLTSVVSPVLGRGLDFALQEPVPRMERIVWETEGQRRVFEFPERYRDRFKDPSGIKFTPWVSCYVGLFAFVLALIGAASFGKEHPWRLLAFAAAGGTVAVLLLGAHTRASLWLWANIPLLGFLRGPARLSILLTALLVPLAARGMDRLGRGEKTRRAAAAAALLVLLELLWTGWGYYPTMPKDYYGEKGRLVSFLRDRLQGARYLQYPTSEVWAYVDKDDPSEDYRRFKEEVFKTFRQKLFGVSNSVYHLPAASGSFEPLVHRAVLGVLKTMEGADDWALAEQMKWTGTRYWLSRRPDKRRPLVYEGEHLWHAFKAPGAISRAYWLPEGRRGTLEGTLEEASAGPDMRPWSVDQERADRIRIRGEAPAKGLLYIAEPRYRGWEAYLNGRRTPIKDALGAFMFLECAEGAVDAVLRYRPGPWKAGLLISLLALLGLAAAGVLRLEGQRRF